MGLFGKKKSPFPASGLRPPPPGSIVIAQDANYASQMDAADGVIDGKYYGAPVYQKAPPNVTPTYLLMNQPQQSYQNHYSPQYPRPPPSHHRSNFSGAVVPKESAARGYPPGGCGCTTACGEGPLYLPDPCPPAHPPLPSEPELRIQHTLPPRPDYDPDANQEHRPWVGVAVKWMDDALSGGRDNVAVVDEVIEGSPAFRAHLRKNDVLVDWDGDRIDGPMMWEDKVRRMRIDDVVNMGVRRNHKDLRVLLRITALKKSLVKG